MRNKKFKAFLTLTVCEGIISTSVSCYLGAIGNPLWAFFLPFGMITGIAAGVVRGYIYGEESRRY